MTATFSEAMTAATISSATVELRDAANALVPAAITYSPALRTATLDPVAPLNGLATYTATVKGGSGGVADAAGNQMAQNFSWTFTTAAPRACPCSIWSTAATPEDASMGDTNSVELGLRFRADVAGYVTGIRFYKGPANTGVHEASLWTGSGTLLGRATFTNETAGGWQQVSFATPIAVQANTTYIASYHAPNGGYSRDRPYFDTAGVDNPPLRALRDGVDGGNGLFDYGASSLFPTRTSLAANYWVDVVFAYSAP